MKDNTSVENKFQYDNVILVSLAHLLHDTYSAFLAPVLPLLIDKLGISLFLSGILSVIQRVPALLNPFIGLIADKISMRYLIIISPSITAIAMSCLGLAPNYFVLVVLLLVMGIGSSLFHVPSPVMVRKVSGKRLGMGMSFYMLGGEMARTIGPLVILGAITVWGFEGTWRLIPFALAASAILYFKLRKISIYKDFQNKQKENGGFKTIKIYFLFFAYIAFYLFFAQLTKSAISFYLPTYFSLKGETLWFGGIALSIFQLAGAAGTFVSGTISDKIGRKTALIIASIANPTLMIGFVLSGKSILAFVFLVLMGIFMFASTPVLLALVNGLKSDRPAFLNSLFMTANFLGGALPVVIIGKLSDHIGMAQTFIICAVFAYLGVLFAWLLLKEHKKK